MSLGSIRCLIQALPSTSCVAVAKSSRPLRSSFLIGKKKNEKRHLMGPFSSDGELTEFTEWVLGNRPSFCFLVCSISGPA